MLILTYSHLGEGLIKFIDPQTGKYGAVDKINHEVKVSPLYDYLFPFENGRAIALKSGEYLEVGSDGTEYFDRVDYQINTFAMKADYCPDCHNTTKKSCDTCNGWGVIALNFDFDCD